MPSLTVIGDVNVEISGRVEIPFSRIEDDLLAYGPLTMRIGGTAPNFASAACGLFEPVHVLGCVGADELGLWAEQSLKNMGVDARLRRDPSLPTGLAVSIRDSTASGGLRLLLVRSDNANRMLDGTHIASNVETLTGADFFVTDGYSLLREPRRRATLAAMRTAATDGAQVVVDVVPHDCYRLIGHSDLREWLAFAHIVVAEVRTVRRLLGLSTPESIIDLPLALEAMERLHRAFPGRSLLLRFGEKNIAESLVCRPGRGHLHRFTGFTGGSASQDFGDELTVGELAQYFFRVS